MDKEEEQGIREKVNFFYREKCRDTILLRNKQMFNSLNQNGYINYMYPINETSLVNLKLVPQQE